MNSRIAPIKFHKNSQNFAVINSDNQNKKTAILYYDKNINSLTYREVYTTRKEKNVKILAIIRMNLNVQYFDENLGMTKEQLDKQLKSLIDNNLISDYIVLLKIWE